MLPCWLSKYVPSSVAIEEGGYYHDDDGVAGHELRAVPALQKSEPADRGVVEQKGYDAQYRKQHVHDEGVVAVANGKMLRENGKLTEYYHDEDGRFRNGR